MIYCTLQTAQFITDYLSAFIQFLWLIDAVIAKFKPVIPKQLNRMLGTV